jgi:hypothetical protein
MLGSGKRTEHHHVDASYWAGPGLVRMVCNRCGRVRLDLSDLHTRLAEDQNLGVDCLAWMAAEPA